MSHQHKNLEDTVYMGFGSNDTSGSGGDGSTPVYDVRLGGAAADAAPVYSAAATLLTHANYPPGAHEIAVPATTANGFVASGTYSVFSTILVDSQNPTGFMGSFSLQPIISNVIQISDDPTAASNLELACDNYSVTRGLTGTALPAAAADGVGGVPISDAGELDLDSVLSGNTPQSADNNTILAHADYGNAQLVRSTTPANTLDVSGTGEAGLDFANIKDATGAHTLTNITVPTCTTNSDMVTEPPTAAAIVNEWESQSQSDPTGFHVNVMEVNGTGQTANDNGADINTLITQVGTAGDGLTEAGGDGDHLTAINLPNQTMDIAGNITGNMSGSVGSVTGAVGSVTGAVGSVAGAVGSVTARVTANTDQIAGVAGAATKLAASAGSVVVSAAATGTLSTTEMTTTLTEVTNDHYNGRVIIWTSGNLKDQATDITGYTGATKLLKFTAVTEAPANNDTFVIV